MIKIIPNTKLDSFTNVAELSSDCLGWLVLGVSTTGVAGVVIGSADLVVVGSADLVVTGSADLVVVGSADFVVVGSAALVVVGSADFVVVGFAVSMAMVVLPFSLQSRHTMGCLKSKVQSLQLLRPIQSLGASNLSQLIFLLMESLQ